MGCSDPTKGSRNRLQGSVTGSTLGRMATLRALNNRNDNCCRRRASG